jgi:hypothetical protein
MYNGVKHMIKREKELSGDSHKSVYEEEKDVNAGN